MNVLHIQSSPRGDKSNSIALTKAFLSASRKVLPTIDEDVLNIWDQNLPEFDAASIGAKYKAIKQRTPDRHGIAYMEPDSRIDRSLPASEPNCPGRTDVELLHPIQAQAVDRSDRSAQLPVHV
jgi:hypothetical protein